MTRALSNETPRGYVPRGDSLVKRGPFLRSPESLGDVIYELATQSLLVRGAHIVLSPPSWDTSVSGPRDTDKHESWWGPWPISTCFDAPLVPRQASLAENAPSFQGAWLIPLRRLQQLWPQSHVEVKDGVHSLIPRNSISSFGGNWPLRSVATRGPSAR